MAVPVDLVSVSIYLFAFTFIPLPQLGGLTWAESAEGKCPYKEGRENSEEELVVWSSARPHLNNRRHSNLRWSHGAGDRSYPAASHAVGPLAIVGHQLANGLCAPLLI